MQKIYPYLISPQDYSEYTSRYAPVTTWEDLGGKVLFSILKRFEEDNGKLVNYEEKLDLYTKQFKLGTVLAPFCSMFRMDNFDEFINTLFKRNLFLFDIWGYVPGFDPSERIWGNYIVPPKALKTLNDTLGKHFMGVENGEQDGRYIGSYAYLLYPHSQDGRKQYIHFCDFFEKMADDLGHHLNALCSLNYGHYFAHMGNHTILGGETAQALPNANVWYAYLRGAGKQYGLLWFGNASVWNRSTYKNYSESGDQGQYGEHGPEFGTSLSLLRRLMITHYSYNCAILGFESGWFYCEKMQGDKEERELPRLTPIGELQAGCVEMIEKNGMAGVMHTPTAIVLDFYGGWTFPRHLYSKSVYQIWGNRPYEQGDYQIHALYSMLYPGYEDAGFYRNERGFLAPTPYGDAFDVLLDNAGPDVLSMYNLLVLVGRQRLDDEISDKLKDYVTAGGSVVLFGEQLKEMSDTSWTGVCLTGEESLLSESTICYDGRLFTGEKLMLQQITVDDGAGVLAMADGQPLITCASRGKGRVYVVASPYGLIADSLCVPSPIDNNENQTIPLYYDFLSSVKAFLADLFNGEKLIDPGNPALQYTSGWNTDGSLMVTLCNNGDQWQSYELTSFVGDITRISEWKTPEYSPETLGFFPKVAKEKLLETVARVPKETQIIAPGDIKVFTLQIDCPAVELLPPKKKTQPVKGRILSLWGIADLREEVLTFERLGQYFDGVKIEARYVQSTDIDKLKKEGAVMKRLGYRVIVDFAGLLNHYPDFTLLDNLPYRWEESRRGILNILGKMKEAGFTQALFFLHQNAENACWPFEIAVDAFKKNIGQLADDAASLGIDILLSARPTEIFTAAHVEKKTGITTAETLALIKDIGRPNLGFVLDTCHSIMVNEDIPELLQKYQDRISMVAVGTPMQDEYGQYYNAHNPVFDSRWEDSIHKAIEWIAEKDPQIPICLNAAYRNWNAVYRDLKSLSLHEPFKK